LDNLGGLQSIRGREGEGKSTSAIGYRDRRKEWEAILSAAWGIGEDLKKENRVHGAFTKEEPDGGSQPSTSTGKGVDLF